MITARENWRQQEERIILEQLEKFAQDGRAKKLLGDLKELIPEIEKGVEQAKHVVNFINSLLGLPFVDKDKNAIIIDGVTFYSLLLRLKSFILHLYPDFYYNTHIKYYKNSYHDLKQLDQFLKNPLTKVTKKKIEQLIFNINSLLMTDIGKRFSIQILHLLSQYHINLPVIFNYVVKLAGEDSLFYFNALTAWLKEGNTPHHLQFNISCISTKQIEILVEHIAINNKIDSLELEVGLYADQYKDKDLMNIIASLSQQHTKKHLSVSFFNPDATRDNVSNDIANGFAIALQRGLLPPSCTFELPECSEKINNTLAENIIDANSPQKLTLILPEDSSLLLPLLNALSALKEPIQKHLELHITIYHGLLNYKLGEALINAIKSDIGYESLSFKFTLTPIHTGTRCNKQFFESLMIAIGCLKHQRKITLDLDFIKQQESLYKITPLFGQHKIPPNVMLTGFMTADEFLSLPDKLMKEFMTALLKQSSIQINHKLLEVYKLRADDPKTDLQYKYNLKTIIACATRNEFLLKYPHLINLIKETCYEAKLYEPSFHPIQQESLLNSCSATIFSLKNKLNITDENYNALLKTWPTELYDLIKAIEEIKLTMTEKSSELLKLNI